MILFYSLFNEFAVKLWPVTEQQLQRWKCFLFFHYFPRGSPPAAAALLSIRVSVVPTSYLVGLP